MNCPWSVGSISAVTGIVMMTMMGFKELTCLKKVTKALQAYLLSVKINLECARQVVSTHSLYAALSAVCGQKGRKSHFHSLCV